MQKTIALSNKAKKKKPNKPNSATPKDSVAELNTKLPPDGTFAEAFL